MEDSLVDDGMQTKDSKIVSIFAILLIVAGVFIIAYNYIPGWYNTTKSENWPTAQGTILSSEIKVYGGKSVSYKAEISYSYSVDGVDYSSDRISFMYFTAGGHSLAEELVNKYPVGASVNIHYEPENPSEAVLDPSVQDPFQVIAVLIAAIIMMIVGIIILVLMFVKRRKRIKEEQNALHAPRKYN